MHLTWFPDLQKNGSDTGKRREYLCRSYRSPRIRAWGLDITCSIILLNTTICGGKNQCFRYGRYNLCAYHPCVPFFVQDPQLGYKVRFLQDDFTVLTDIPVIAVIFFISVPVVSGQWFSVSRLLSWTVFLHHSHGAEASAPSPARIRFLRTSKHKNIRAETTPSGCSITG